jgi:ribosome maturation factor RimP
MQQDELFQDLESRVEALGFELVDLQRAGDARRPILRLRIDRPDSVPGVASVSLDDCARVSRALEADLDSREGLSPHYVLEVSSPGVERPLVRPRDWERFAGQEILIRGKGSLAGRGSRLQGTLLGRHSAEPGELERVELRLDDGEDVRIPMSDIKSANLVFQWGKQSRPG